MRNQIEDLKYIQSKIDKDLYHMAIDPITSLGSFIFHQMQFNEILILYLEDQKREKENENTET